MCGIVGYQGSFPPGLIEAMTTTLSHRGPDGHGVRMLDQGRTALGHCRLSIIDLSHAGCQPMTAGSDRGGGEREGLTLVFNGEIYNFRLLRDELERDGHRFRSATDSEVLLHLYEAEGFSMLSRLNGIFSFAIHDERPDGRPDGVERGALFLARDHLGVKPLYYTELPEGFAFASELKALLHLPSLPREIDAVAIHQMLAYLWTPAPRTALAGIRKLEPGAALLVHDGRIQRDWAHYRMPYNGRTSHESFATLAGKLEALVARAVERQLVADVPVGAFLSGGLDSSAVVAMMRRAWPDRTFPCFTIHSGADDPSDGATSDLPYARRVARHLSLPLEEIVLEPDAIHRLPEMIWWLDEPQADPAPINALLIAERARAMGIPVLLSGAGGDDLFSGYRRHWALGFEKTWSWLPRWVLGPLARGARGLSEGAFPGQARASVRRLAKMFVRADDVPDRRLVSYFQWTTERARRGLYTAAFAANVRDVDTDAPLLDSLSHIPCEQDRLQKLLYLEARHFLADHNLNYTDRAGMAAGVEIRVPLLDVDLVEFAASVPSAHKQRGRVGKAIFKKAMEPNLPREVIYRQKTGFGAPLRRWLRWELRSMVDDTLGEETLRRRGLFEPAAVHRLIALDRAGRVDGAYLIFALMSVELWCRRFIDD
jgi:asparagine synthase (glutamine-hydrolysing)